MEINTIKKMNRMEINANGHADVDLGLPSGTMWAKMNVGAKKETDYGLYFAWGETEGYAASQIPSQKKFNWGDYNFGSRSPFSKYDNDDEETALDLEDDAASVSMGGEWHMPTVEQCKELFNTDYVINEWVTDYQGSGISGRLFTSVSNGNTLFIPAAGVYLNGLIYDVNEFGNVWCSSLCIGNVNSALGLYFDGIVDDVDYYGRCGGRSVRGVISKPFQNNNN